ncbi:MAG: glycerophosphodiester phosphodiesterase [Alphaproteobacteria bacterium]|nr:glycerophosphodiester phosphodiesterase [Alphaproteobacteria bacterium]
MRSVESAPGPAARPASGELALPLVIGHRGAAASAPENTLASMRKAHKSGARWVEFDVRLSADGRCIVLHDDTIDRTTDGTGAAASLTFAALRRYDAGAWFGPEFAGERIPAFDELIGVLGSLGLGANVEIKPAAGREEATARAVVALLRELWPASLPPPLLSSFAPQSLKAAREAAPELRRGCLFQRLPADWKARAEALDCATIHCGERALTQRQVEAVRDAGYPMLVYTVNDPRRAVELIGWGATAVFSDCPDRIIAALASDAARLAGAPAASNR